MDMLESETRRLEALYGLKAKRPFYYCGTWCIMTLSALEVGHQKMCHESLLIIQSFLYNVCEICLKNTNFFFTASLRYKTRPWEMGVSP